MHEFMFGLGLVGLVLLAWVSWYYIIIERKSNVKSDQAQGFED